MRASRSSTRYTGELRASTKKDMGDIARLVDALHEVDVFEMAVVSSDQPPASFSLHNHEAAIVNQTKPISGGALDGARSTARWTCSPPSRAAPTPCASGR